LDNKDAEQTGAPTRGVHIFKVDPGRGFHFEKPGEFIQIRANFSERIGK
jgi:hypothetical protein